MADNPKVEAKQVDTQTNGIHTTLKGGPIINFEGGHNTNFKCKRDVNHVYWPNGTRSHLHTSTYPPMTSEEQYPATVNAKPVTHGERANTSSRDGLAKCRDGHTTNLTFS